MKLLLCLPIHIKPRSHQLQGVSMKHITMGFYAILLCFLLTVMSKAESYQLNFSYNQYSSNLTTIITNLSTKIYGADLRETLYRPNSIYATIEVINEQDIHAIVVLRINDLSVQGFIANNTYYYFPNATVKRVTGTKIAKVLPFSSDYQELHGFEATLNTTKIDEAIIYLANFKGQADHNTKLSLVRIMYITTESLRFKTIAVIVEEDILQQFLTIPWRETSKILNSWDNLSAQGYFLKYSDVLNIAKGTVSS